MVRWQLDGFEDLVRFHHDDSPEEIAFSPDGKLLATGSTGDVQVWETATGRRLYGLDTEEFEGKGFFSPDGKLLAQFGYSFDHKPIPIWVYEASTGKLVSRISDTEVRNFSGFRADSRGVLTTGRDNLRKVWDPFTGKLLDTIPGPALPAHLKEGERVFSPNGKWFCGVGEDEILRVWEVSTGKEVFQLGRAWEVFQTELLGKPIKRRIKNYDQIIFSPTGQYLVAIKGHTMEKDYTVSSTVIAWEVASGRQVASVDDPQDQAYIFAVKPTFDPSGKILAVVTRDNLVHLMDLATGRELARLKHDVKDVTDLTFSSDGHWLAAATRDHIARVWELPSGREVARLEHPNQVMRVAFSPDGSRLATACLDKQVRLWYWRTADLVAAACRRLPRNLSREEWREYLGDEPYRPTCSNLPAPEK